MNITPQSPSTIQSDQKPTIPYVLSPFQRRMRQTFQKEMSVSPSELSIDGRRNLVAKRSGASVLTSDRVRKRCRTLTCSKTRVWERIHGRVEERNYLLKKSREQETIDFLERFRLSSPKTPMIESPSFEDVSATLFSEDDSMQNGGSEIESGEENDSFFYSSDESLSPSPIKVKLSGSEIPLTLDQVNEVVQDLTRRLIEKEQEVKILKEENKSLKLLFSSASPKHPTSLNKKVAEKFSTLRITEEMQQQFKKQRKKAHRAADGEFQKESSEDSINNVEMDFFVRLHAPKHGNTSTPEQVKKRRGANFKSPMH